ncbi:hypothetical protein LJB45_39665 [Streptomyces rapamycinicus]|nr:hypothetical protein LJB45_39665 [Streptomyces rapamycinicus]
MFAPGVGIDEDPVTAARTPRSRPTGRPGSAATS